VPSSLSETPTIRLSGNTGLAVRASKKLKNDELLVLNSAASRLRMEMDRVSLWRGNHVGIRKLVDGVAENGIVPFPVDTTYMLCQRCAV
jgi:hypothetical protein